MPRTITHESALQDAATEIAQFFEDIEALQPKLGVVLIQLPPTLEFGPAEVRSFFSSLPVARGTRLVCEPRHASWFTGPADALLERLDVTRVATDPSAFAAAKHPGGSRKFAYFRWHGSPRKYYSSYPETQIKAFAADVIKTSGRDAWCIFDNTAAHAAWPNAQVLASILRS
jgi:uncharacterized protein YecE (DUF72 family)